MMKSLLICCALVLVSIGSPACAQKGSMPEPTSRVKSSTEPAKSTAETTAKPATKPAAKAGDVAAAKSPGEQSQPMVDDHMPEADDLETSSTNGHASVKKPARADSRSKSKEPLSAEQEKQVKAMLRQTLKSFAAAELTEEQKQQADELFVKAIRSFVVKRSEAQITDELQKKQAAGLKEAKASGKSLKEQANMAFESAGFNEEQIKVFKSTETSLTKAKRDFAKLLGDEQIACLPEAVQSLIAKK